MHMTLERVLGVQLILLVVLLSNNACGDPLVVSTANGAVRGEYLSQGNSSCRVWYGIPYSVPPVGPRRWLPATSPAPWSGIRDATNPAPGCPQRCSLPPGHCPPATSEDCLYLNVFAPLTDSSSLKSSSLSPVMVFIHGGNFLEGMGTDSFYDGTTLVNRTGDLLLVTVNYRLGALGFFFQPQASSAHALRSSEISTSTLTVPNLGLLDQKLALQWVQENIEDFGGDPTRVTLFGQSAGATSVAAHLQNGHSPPLFQRAILQSVPLGIPLREPDEAEKINELFAAALDCSSGNLTCLQAASVEAVLTAQSKAGSSLSPDWGHLLEIAQSWQPVIRMGPFLLPKQPAEFLPGYTGAPLMLGVTSQEVYLFVWAAYNKSMSVLEAGALEAVLFGLEPLSKMNSFYPLHLTGDNRSPVSDMGTDELFVCPARNVSLGIAAAGNWDSYYYVFDHVPTDAAHGWGPDYEVCYTHVCHGTELAFVFNSAQAAELTETPQEQALSDSMQVWVSGATVQQCVP